MNISNPQDEYRSYLKLRFNRSVDTSKSTSLNNLTDKVLLEIPYIKDSDRECLKQVLLVLIEQHAYQRVYTYPRTKMLEPFKSSQVNRVMIELQDAGYITQWDNLKPKMPRPFLVTDKALPMNAKNVPYIDATDIYYDNSAPGCIVQMKNNRGKKIDKTANLNNDDKEFLKELAEQVTDYRESLLEHTFSFVERYTQERVYVTPSEHLNQRRVFNDTKIVTGGSLHRAWHLQIRKVERRTIEINDIPVLDEDLTDLTNAQLRFLHIYHNAKDSQLDTYANFLKVTTGGTDRNHRKIIKAIMLPLLANDSLISSARAAERSITRSERKLEQHELDWVNTNYGLGRESGYATIKRMQGKFIAMHPAHFPKGERSLKKTMIGILQKMQSTYLLDVLTTFKGGILGIHDGFLIANTPYNLNQFERVSNQAMQKVINSSVRRV